MALLNMPKRGEYKPGASIAARALAAGIPRSTVDMRMRNKGMSLDEAIAAGIPRRAAKTVTTTHTHAGGRKMKKYIKRFRIETASGRIIAHADAIEAAEWIAHRGKGRWVYRWFDGRYVAVRQYR